MANRLDYLEPSKTYATRENAIKAFEKKFGDTEIRYMIVEKGGRFYPIAIGSEAVHAGTHFHFVTVG